MSQDHVHHFGVGGIPLFPFGYRLYRSVFLGQLNGQAVKQGALPGETAHHNRENLGLTRLETRNSARQVVAVKIFGTDEIGACQYDDEVRGIDSLLRGGTDRFAGEQAGLIPGFHLLVLVQWREVGIQLPPKNVVFLCIQTNGAQSGRQTCCVSRFLYLTAVGKFRDKGPSINVHKVNTVLIFEKQHRVFLKRSRLLHRSVIDILIAQFKGVQEQAELPSFKIKAEKNENALLRFANLQQAVRDGIVVLNHTSWEFSVRIREPGSLQVPNIL